MQRDVKFDGLRVIGLLAIILAHVNPPSLLFQIRNFDVPLMVLVSGAVYGLSGTNKQYFSYIGERIARLLAPTWVFLLIFFVFNAMVGNFFSTDKIIDTVTLINGIGYVWIIRVFILVALIAPLFVYLYKKIHNKQLYLLSVFGVFILYYFFNKVFISSTFLQGTQSINFFIQNYVFYLLSYGAIAGLGLYLLHASKKVVLTLFLLFSGVFVVFAYKYHFVSTQLYKYPPGIYYLAYALAISLLLYLISYTKVFQTIFRLPLLQFIAKASLWIYLWQIFFLYQRDVLHLYLGPVMNGYLGEYIVIVTLSVSAAYVHRRLIAFFVKKLKDGLVKTCLIFAFLK